MKRNSPLAETMASNSRVTERSALACPWENSATRSGIKLFGIVLNKTSRRDLQLRTGPENDIQLPENDRARTQPLQRRSGFQNKGVSVDGKRGNFSVFRNCDWPDGQYF